jgi:hypothetical protein
MPQEEPSPRPDAAGDEDEADVIGLDPLAGEPEPAEPPLEIDLADLVLDVHELAEQVAALAVETRRLWGEMRRLRTVLLMAGGALLSVADDAEEVEQ